MTRIVGEPSAMKDLAGESRKVESLSHRPAPVVVPAGAIEGVILYAWNYDTDNTVTTTTWTSVAAFTAGGGFYEEAFEFPLNSSFGWDHETGIISNSTDGLYVAHGYVQFWDDAVAGESRAIAINHGSSLRYVNEITCKTATGVGDHHLIVSESWLVGFGSYSAMLECWHDHGSDITIRDAQFSVFLMGLYTDAAQFYIHDPFA
jgi:hypothetical protein